MIKVFLCVIMIIIIGCTSGGIKNEETIDEVFFTMEYEGVVRGEYYLHILNILDHQYIVISTGGIVHSENCKCRVKKDD